MLPRRKPRPRRRAVWSPPSHGERLSPPSLGAQTLAAPRGLCTLRSSLTATEDETSSSQVEAGHLGRLRRLAHPPRSLGEVGGGAGHTSEIRARLSPINYNPGAVPACPLATPKPVASVQLNLLSLQCPLPLHWAPRGARLELGRLMPMDVTGRCQAEATPPHLYPSSECPVQGRHFINQPTDQRKQPWACGGPDTGYRGRNGAREASLPGTTMLRPSGQLTPALDLEEWRTASWWGSQEEGRPRREGVPAPLPSCLGDTSQRHRDRGLCPVRNWWARAEAGRTGPQQHTI